MNRGWMVVLGAVAACGGNTPVAGDPLVLETGCERLLGVDGAQQGVITRTERVFDVALDGPGYFVLNDHGAPGYTRDGRFTLDAQGFLSTAGGARVQAYGDLARAPDDLMVGSALAPPIPTSVIVLRANLNADAPVQVFDPISPSTSSNFSSSTWVFDQLGHSVSVDVYWNKSVAGSWEFHAMVDGQHAAGWYPGVTIEIATGTLAFDANGKLMEVTQSSSWNPPDQYPQQLYFYLGSPTNQGGAGLDGVTQFAAPSSTSYTAQDGARAGVRTDLTLTQRGEVMASFSSGISKVIGILAVANFPAPHALYLGPQHVLAETAASGRPLVAPASEVTGLMLLSGALEQLHPTPNACAR